MKTDKLLFLKHQVAEKLHKFVSEVEREQSLSDLNRWVAFDKIQRESQG